MLVLQLISVGYNLFLHYNDILDFLTKGTKSPFFINGKGQKSHIFNATLN